MTSWWHHLFQLGADVFNALDVMENKSVFEALKFGIGDGNLHYYLYNYKCPEIKPEMVSATLHQPLTKSQ